LAPRHPSAQIQVAVQRSLVTRLLVTVLHHYFPASHLSRLMVKASPLIINKVINIVIRHIANVKHLT